MPRLSKLQARFLFLNIGHAFDHWFVLIYATAVLALAGQFDLTYGELMALSTPGFIAFGLGAVPAGWLGDRWSRHGMMTVFFVGLGLSSILVGLARTPLELAAALTLLGIFAAIYHPVGIAMVAEGAPETLGWRIGVNGVWGNMGVAGAAVITGLFIDLAGWRSAFILPGLLSVATGIGFALLVRRWQEPARPAVARRNPGTAIDPTLAMRIGWKRVLGVVALATVLGSIIFNGITIAMPKVFEERLTDITTTATGIGLAASIIYMIAAFAQIVVGRALDRYPVRPLLTVIAAGQVLALSAAAAAANWSMLLAAGLLMILVFGQVPIGSTLIARYTPDTLRSRIYGLQYLMVFGLGALAVPLIAVLHGWSGFFGLFVVLAAMAVGTLVVAQALPDVRPQPARQPAPATPALGEAD